MPALNQLVDAWKRVPDQIRPEPGASLEHKQYWRFVHWLLDRWETFGPHVLAELHVHELNEQKQIRAFTLRAQRALTESRPEFDSAFDEHIGALIELDKRERLPRRGAKAFQPQSVSKLLDPNAPLRAHFREVFAHWAARLGRVHDRPHARPLWEAIGADRSTPDGPGVRNARGLAVFMCDFDATWAAAGVSGYCWAAGKAIETASKPVIRAVFDAGYDRLLAGQTENPWVAAHCLNLLVRLRANPASTTSELTAAEEWFDALNPMFLRWWPKSAPRPLHGFPREANSEIGVLPHMFDWVISERRATSLPNERLERYVLAAAFLLDRLADALASNPAAGSKVAIILEGTKNRPKATLSTGVLLERVSQSEANFLAALSETGSARGLAPMVTPLKKRLEVAGVECGWKGSTKGLRDRNGQERLYSARAWIGTVADFRD